MKHITSPKWVTAAVAIASVISIAGGTGTNAAGAATCGPTQLQASVTGFTAHNLDDFDNDDEVNILASATATNGSVGALITPTIKVHAGETIMLPADQQVIFDKVIGGTDNVAINFHAKELDGNYLNAIPADVRSKVEAQLKSKALAADPYAIAAYLATIGYDYFAKPDRLALMTFSLSACGPAQEDTSQYFKHQDSLGFVSKYTFFFRVTRKNLATCQGKTPTVIGTDGDDTLTGTPGPDVIVGLGGNDSIDGLGGDDLVCGGAGNDRLVGSDGNDTLIGEDGDGLLTGNAGNDRLEGWAGADNLQGGQGDDLLFGGVGDDTLIGGLGADVLYGEDGADTLYHSNTTDDDKVKDTLDAGGGGGRCNFTALDNTANCTIRF